MSNHSKQVLILILALFCAFGCSSKPNDPVKPSFSHGDINLNGLANEVADAVLFSNYFVYGLGVFTVDQAEQIAETDVNKDGTSLTIADLVYLTRIVIGDAMPKPKTDSLTVRYRQYTYSGILSVMDNVKIGAASIVLEGNVEPTLLANNMKLEYAYDAANDVTRTLVYSMGKGQSFTGEFMNTRGANLIGVEMATFEGQPVKLELFYPDPFYLFQNYPNPFALETIIQFSLYSRSEATLIISNQEGTPVFELTQFYEAGFHLIDWKAQDEDRRKLPGGTYFCSLTVGGHTQSIEMFLIGPS